MAWQPSREMRELYLQRHLSDEDEERIELWLMDNPRALDDYALDEVMRQHIEAVSRPWRWSTLVSKYSPAVAFAASILVVASAVLLLYREMQFQQLQTERDALRQPLLEFNSIVLSGTRTVAPEPLTITLDPQPHVVEFLLPVAAAGPYRTIISLPSGGQFRTQDGYANDDGYLRLLMHSSLLPPGLVVIETWYASGLERAFRVRIE